MTAHFNIFGPSSLILSDRPHWHFWTVHFDSTKGPSTFGRMTVFVTLDRPLWLKRPSTIVLHRPLWLKWPYSLAQDRPLLNGPSNFTLLGQTLWNDPFKIVFKIVKKSRDQSFNQGSFCTGESLIAIFCSDGWRSRVRNDLAAIFLTIFCKIWQII